MDFNLLRMPGRHSRNRNDKLHLYTSIIKWWTGSFHNSVVMMIWIKRCNILMCSSLYHRTSYTTPHMKSSSSEWNIAIVYNVTVWSVHVCLPARASLGSGKLSIFLLSNTPFFLLILSQDISKPLPNPWVILGWMPWMETLPQRFFSDGSVGTFASIHIHDNQTTSTGDPWRPQKVRTFLYCSHNVETPDLHPTCPDT